MSEDKHRDPQLRISFSDLISILQKSKKTILYFAVAFGMLGLFWGLRKPIRYEAEATFREKGIKHASLPTSSSFMQMLAFGGSGGTESEAASLMKSRAILKDVIEKLHLQADLRPIHEGESFPKLAARNLLLAWNSFNNGAFPILSDPCCPIKFAHLKYTGETPLSFRLEMDENGQMQIYKNSSLIGEGHLGVPFEFDNLSFIIVKNDNDPLVPQTYSLTINSLVETAKSMDKILKIETPKVDKSFLQDKSLLIVKYNHRDRLIASQIVNAVMDSYQAYAQNYHIKMANKQLDYLSTRRDQLSGNLTGLMQKHANFLANDLYGSGFIESNKEMDFLAKSQHEYKRKLLDNELEIKRLMEIKDDDFSHYDRYSANDVNPVIINNIYTEMSTLKQQRDGLQIEIQKKAVNQGANLQHFFDMQVDELKDVQQLLMALREINTQFKQNVMPDPNSKLLNDPRYLLKGWFSRLQNARQENQSWITTKDSLQLYLNNLERLFGVHERILQERLTHQQNPSSEYRGINLEDATELYRDYSKQIIQLENTIRQNTFFISQIENPNFEITSLSAGLNDSISAEIIHKASSLVQKLRDQNNQSVREQERIKEELHLERTFLNLHLQQMVQLMELNKQLINEKIAALQNVSLELIHQRISLLEKNLQDYLQSRLNHLKQERELIKRHLETIHTEMAQLPQKWVSEQLLTQEVATNHLIVEEIAKLVETKNISHNLEVIQSAPVDVAYPSLHPIAPPVFLLGFLGFSLGGFLGACFSLGRSVIKS